MIEFISNVTGIHSGYIQSVILFFLVIVLPRQIYKFIKENNIIKWFQKID